MYKFSTIFSLYSFSRKCSSNGNDFFFKATCNLYLILTANKSYDGVHSKSTSDRNKIIIQNVTKTFQFNKQFGTTQKCFFFFFCINLSVRK